jgi:tetratricopeptide (TPR) repeat protein
MPRFYLIYIFIFWSISLTSQSTGKLLRQARDAQRNRDWVNAARLYENLLLRDSSRLDWYYAYAEAVYFNYDLNEALSRFTIITLRDNQKKYPLSYYYKARILQSKENYKEAIKNYKKFLSVKKKNIPEFYKQHAEKQISGCEYALNINKKEKNIRILPLDTVINSTLSEYAPFETDSVLYFTSLRNKVRKYEEDKHTNKIYFSNLKAPKLSIKALDSLISSDFSDNGNYFEVPGTNFILFSRCRNIAPSEYQCEVWKAEKAGSRYRNPEKLPTPVNIQGFNNTHPSTAVLNGKTYLFFSSNRQGSLGKMDVWKCEIISLKDNQFGPAENLGNEINTADDDITPHYDSVERKLYFSSAFHPGLGGFDIFYSVWNGEKFSTPVNAGYPVNSSHNDVYFSINNTHTYAYLSSNRTGSRFEGKQNCCNDIYRFPLQLKKDSVPPTLPKTDSSVVMKNQLKLLVPLTLYFHNDEPDPKTRNTQTQKSYDETYHAYLKLTDEYKKEYSSGLEKNDKETAVARIEEFFTDSVKAGYDDLIKFTTLMEKILTRQRDTVFITIKGYCSPLASTDYNINLAKRRISSLKNFFSRYNNGFFKPYLEGTAANGSRIIYEDVDIGELPYSKVSDDLRDKKNSVYSPFAARERKIQILAVKFSDKTQNDGKLSD